MTGPSHQEMLKKYAEAMKDIDAALKLKPEMGDYLKLKMRLMPYMYTAAWEAEQQGAPIVRGMMWDHPNDPNAYTEAYKYQFFLGKDFLVAPIFRSQAASKGWRKGIYLPQGQWVDYWDGRVVEADANGKLIDYQVTLDKLPVFVRAGAILPMYPSSLYDGQVPKDVLTLDIYPHGKSEFTLYEDDGESRDYQTGQHSLQRFSVDAPIGKAGEIKIAIDGVIGSYQGMEAQRVYQLQVHSRVKPDAVFLQEQLLPQFATQAEFEHANSGWFYDVEKTFGLLYVKTEKVVVANSYQVRVVVDANAKLATTSGFSSAPQLPPTPTTSATASSIAGR